MTLAQQYLQQGRQEGRQEGALDSLRQAVLDALEVRFGGVSEDLREAVAAVQEEPKLRALLRTAIQAETPEAVRLRIAE